MKNGDDPNSFAALVTKASPKKGCPPEVAAPGKCRSWRSVEFEKFVVLLALDASKRLT